jgi:DNA-binding transcriptional MocR family regulator
MRPGSKAPSIRQFAHAHNVSVFTVVDAYDRLVAQGYFASRPHSAFLSSSVPTSVTELPGHGPEFQF